MRTTGYLLLTLACASMLTCAGSSSPGGPTDGPPAPDPGNWEIRGGLSVPRTENSVAELGGFLWVVGGFGATPMPTSRHGLGAAVLGGSIWVVGGGPRAGLSTSAANERFTP